MYTYVSFELLYIQLNLLQIFKFCLFEFAEYYKKLLRIFFTLSDICIKFLGKNWLNKKTFHSLTGEGAAVLLRGIDPLDGIDHMQKVRSQKTLKEKDLCNGPSKLCQALKISKDKFNKVDMTSSDEIWLEDGEDLPETKIVTGARININYAEEWAQKPLRFYILGNKSVSKRDKAAEDSLSRVWWEPSLTISSLLH